MDADVLSLDEARARRRAAPRDDAEPEADRHITDESVLAGEL